MQLSVKCLHTHVSHFQQPQLLVAQFFLQTHSVGPHLATTIIQDEAHEPIHVSGRLINGFRCAEFAFDKKSVVTLAPQL
jgi:hypothetical protein